MSIVVVVCSVHLTGAVWEVSVWMTMTIPTILVRFCVISSVLIVVVYMFIVTVDMIAFEISIYLAIVVFGPFGAVNFVIFIFVGTVVD